MVGFVIALVWWLIAWGTDADMHWTTSTITISAMWFYGITSVCSFFLMFSINNRDVYNEFINLSPFIIDAGPGPIGFGLFLNFFVTRVLYVVGLYFLMGSTSDSLGVDPKPLVIGTVLIFVTSMMSTVFNALCTAISKANQ